MALAVKWHFKINTSLTHWGWAKWCQSTEIKKKKTCILLPGVLEGVPTQHPLYSGHRNVCVSSTHPHPKSSWELLFPCGARAELVHWVGHVSQVMSWGILGRVLTEVDPWGTSALHLKFHSWTLSPWISWGTSCSETAPGVILVWNPPALISALLKHILCNYSFSFRSGVVGC